MKILFIGHEKELNGASKSMLELIKSFQDRHEITILTQYNKGEFINALQELNVKILYKRYYRWIERRNYKVRWFLYKIRWFLYGNKKNERISHEIAEYVQKNKIDVIHTNSSVIDIGIRIKNLTNTKHLMHIREFGDKDFNMIPFISYDNLFQTMNLGVDRFICISKAIDNHYSKLKNKCIIYNGVSSTNKISIERNFDRVINIIIAGRICEEKGQYIAVEAVVKLIENGINNLKLFLAGSGKIDIPEKYSSHFELLGYVNDLPSIRRKMHIEIVSSKAEAFGRVTVEGMLGGLVVVGSNSGGTPELIQDGKTGILFKCGDSDDLADKLTFLIKNPSIMKKISSTAQKYAINNFYIERCAVEIEQLYRELIQSSYNFGDNV